ncbi:MAG: TetR/AcrR family transcriptional regulator, partial [Desulfobacterales bacterium]|nr:TetR/AcrR family transcriptional regulator [Desulfobacterales bacterium]
RRRRPVSKTTSKIDTETRRTQIVEAALRIIGRDGVAALTTAAMAREVGISEANIYRHFENKNEILREMALKIRAGLERNLSRVSDASSLKALMQIYILQLEYIENNEGIPRLIFSEQLHSSPELKERLLETIGSYADRLADIIRKGQKDGTIKKDIEPMTAAFMFIGMVQVTTLRWSLSGFSFSLAKEGLKLWNSYERCVRA